LHKPDICRSEAVLGGLGADEYTLAGRGLSAVAAAIVGTGAA
jgi:hypothetical protein